MLLSSERTIEEIVENTEDFAILPIGSTEQHGPHLPLCTDCTIVTELAKAVAEKTGAYLLPTLPISTCYEHKGKRGSIWFKPGTFLNMIEELVLTLKDQGFKKIAIMLGHGGIFVSGPAIRELNALYDDLKVIQVEYFGAPKASEIIEMPNNLHACEIETSLMLYYREDLVKMDKAKDADFVPDCPREFLNYKSLVKLSKTGTWGYPSYGTKEKGEKLHKIYVDYMAKYIEETFEKMDYKKW